MKKEFDGYKLKKLLPEDILEKHGNKNDDAEALVGFILALAVTNNDIKGLTFLHDHFVREYRKPKPGEITGHAGEYNGLQMQLLKLLIGQLHEFFELLRDQRSVIESEAFVALERSLSQDNKRLWTDVVSIAQESTKRDSTSQLGFLRSILAQVRNNTSYHISPKCLMQGYRHHFFQMPQEHDGQMHAYFALKSTEFEHTRFFYADAAVQGYIREKIKEFVDIDDFVKKLFKTLPLVSRVIVAILSAYHKTKPSR